MHNSLVAALGGFTTPTRKTRVLFCREIFDYAELEEHPFLCNHLGKKCFNVVVVVNVDTLVVVAVVNGTVAVEMAVRLMKNTGLEEHPFL